MILIQNHYLQIARFKKILKQIIAHLLFCFGILEYLARKKLKSKCVVLMYHRVHADDEFENSYSHEAIKISRNVFHKHMRYLKSNFNVIDLSQFLSTFEKKSQFKSKSCLITFDDGWKDSFEQALPVLHEFQIPATIFLSTGFIGTSKRFWQERLNYMLKALHYRCKSDIKLKKKALNKFRESELRNFILSDGRDLEEKISNFVAKQKKYKEEIVENLIDKMTRFLEIEDDKITQIDDFMSWDEIRIMSNNRIDFGSHGMSHGILTRNENTAHKEISESKTVIEQELHTNINSFSYPNGDYNDEIIRLVRNSGYNIAFGTESGFVSPQDNPYKIKRINIHEDMTESIPMFLSRILRIW